MSNVIVICTDENYINHVKYNIGNIRDRHGEIDICVTYEDKYSTIIERELSLYRVILKPFTKLSELGGPYGSAYHMFEYYFKKWDKVLYIDCDTVVFSNLDLLFNLLNDTNLMLVDYENVTINDFFTIWTPVTESNKFKFNELYNEFSGVINKKGFNAGILLFNTKIIKETTINELYNIHNKYITINNHGQNGNASDQPIINLLFGEITKQIENNYFCYWKNMTESTIIGHFCRWDAPWINGNYNSKLSENYNNYYNRMLIT